MQRETVLEPDWELPYVSTVHKALEERERILALENGVMALENGEAAKLEESPWEAKNVGKAKAPAMKAAAAKAAAKAPMKKAAAKATGKSSGAASSAAAPAKKESAKAGPKAAKAGAAVTSGNEQSNPFDFPPPSWEQADTYVVTK